MSSTGFRFKDEKESAPTGSIDDSSHMKKGKESKSSSSSTKPCALRTFRDVTPVLAADTMVQNLAKGSNESKDSSSMPQHSYTEPGEKGFIMKDEDVKVRFLAEHKLAYQTSTPIPRVNPYEPCPQQIKNRLSSPPVTLLPVRYEEATPDITGSAPPFNPNGDIPSFPRPKLPDLPNVPDEQGPPIITQERLEELKKELGIRRRYDEAYLVQELEEYLSKVLDGEWESDSAVQKRRIPIGPVVSGILKLFGKEVGKQVVTEVVDGQFSSEGAVAK
ncbi:hypothetical protein QBC38DRAFT_445362 [Podospora fimiseda]|uniref:Uncharacterized protein n=1 Tax=Podospora fimiseda TaxID=252190 RepID=A0AAN7H1C3_9PEZI|nr:hypothetical protein QBC38DRAFT_445362 [Podospora fimiseda]